MKRDELFRQWYDARLGTKSEGFAYDVWCAAWKAHESLFNEDEIERDRLNREQLLAALHATR
jgi:hypothetical protein